MPSEGNDATDAAEIEAKLLSVRKESGTLRVVSGRGVQRGDTVICDFDAGSHCSWTSACRACLQPCTAFLCLSC